MVEPARYLLFHGVIVLLLGLLAGIPYGIAINRNGNERLIEAWRVAHAAIPMGAILMIAISAVFSELTVLISIKWSIAILYILSGYSFASALLIAPVVGYRGLSSKGPATAKLVYTGNIIGALTSLSATILLLYAAWQSI